MVEQKWDILLDGKRVYYGTNREIQEHYDMKRAFRGSQYCKLGWRVKGVYTVAPHDKKVNDMPSDPSYDTALRLLKQYHNAFVRYDGERIKRKLARNGIKTDLVMATDGQGCVLWER